MITAGQGLNSAATKVLLKVRIVLPEIGKTVSRALTQMPESAAHHLLAVSEKYLAPIWPDFPHYEVKTVKDILSWSA